MLTSVDNCISLVINIRLLAIVDERKTVNLFVKTNQVQLGSIETQEKINKLTFASPFKTDFHKNLIEWAQTRFCLL